MTIYTSTAYDTEANGDFQRSNPFLLLEWTELGYPFSSAVATTEDGDYPASEAINGRIRESSYTSSGPHPKELWGTFSGWKSTSESDESGNLAVSEVITITYFGMITRQNFMLIAPEDNYPVDFSIDISDDGSVWTNIVTITGNTKPFYGYRSTDRLDEYKYCRITISKISAAESVVNVLQAGAVVSLFLDIYDIDRIMINETLQGETGNPLGMVSSDFCEFGINNEDDYWKYDNADSPFQKIMTERFSLRPFIAMETSADYFESVACGKYYNDSFTYDTDKLIVNFVAKDILYSLIKQAPPIMAVMKNTTIKEIFEALFSGLGLEVWQYKVSKTLTQNVSYGFFAGDVGSDFSGETVGECLQVLAIAGNCNIRSNRWGIIEVRSNFKEGNATETLTDDNQLFKIENVLDFSDVYDSVKVHYRLPMGYSAETEIMAITDYVSGLTNNFLEVEFPDAIGTVTRIQIESSTYTTLTSATIGATRAIIYFTNTTAQETITVRIFGQKLQFLNTSYSDDVSGIDNPQKELKISNWLIQSKDTAKIYVDSLVQYVYNPCNKYNIEIAGNPAIETGSVISVNDSTNIIVKDLQVTKQILTWQGFVNASLECREPLIRRDWVWPGEFPSYESVMYPETVTDYLNCEIPSTEEDF